MCRSQFDSLWEALPIAVLGHNILKNCWLAAELGSASLPMSLCKVSSNSWENANLFGAAV